MTHECIQSEHIKVILEDLKTVTEDQTTIKMELGYKNKSNGEFRKEVTEKDRTLSDSIADIRDTVIRMEEKQKGQDRIIGILFTVFVGALALINYL